MIVPVCAKCNIEMCCIKNEELIQEGDRNGNLYYCDRFGCPSCKVEVYTGFGCAIDPEEELGQILLKKNPKIIRH